MFEQLLKKKKPGTPGSKDNDEADADVQAPEVQATIDQIDAVLKKADADAEREREEMLQKEVRRQKRSSSYCGC